MEERRSAFESLMSYVGGDELLRQHPLVAEFVGASVSARQRTRFARQASAALRSTRCCGSATVAGADASAPRNAQPYPAAPPAAARCVAALRNPRAALI
jgi:hypothetical protein